MSSGFPENEQAIDKFFAGIESAQSSKDFTGRWVVGKDASGREIVQFKEKLNESEQTDAKSGSGPANLRNVAKVLVERVQDNSLKLNDMQKAKIRDLLDVYSQKHGKFEGINYTQVFTKTVQQLTADQVRAELEKNLQLESLKAPEAAQMRKKIEKLVHALEGKSGQNMQLLLLDKSGNTPSLVERVLGLKNLEAFKRLLNCLPPDERFEFIKENDLLYTCVLKGDIEKVEYLLKENPDRAFELLVKKVDNGLYPFLIGVHNKQMQKIFNGVIEKKYSQDADSQYDVNGIMRHARDYYARSHTVQEYVKGWIRF